MEAQDRRNAVSEVVSVLRRATRIVQVAPFVYLVFYAAYMLFGGFVSEETLCIADSFLTMTPTVIGGMLVLSRLFRLCVWHKVACLFPSLSQVEGYVDSYVVTFTQNEILIINITLGLCALAFLFIAVKHFTHGIKRDTK